MYSLTTSENVKMTTVSTPGSEIGKTTRRSACSREQPSIRAASSNSTGIDLKKPISSQIENGTVKLGYTTTSDQSESCNPSFVITRESGGKSSVGGTRYVRKIATPIDCPTRPARRARA